MKLNMQFDRNWTCLGSAPVSNMTNKENGKLKFIHNEGNRAETVMCLYQVLFHLH